MRKGSMQEERERERESGIHYAYVVWITQAFLNMHAVHKSKAESVNEQTYPWSGKQED